MPVTFDFEDRILELRMVGAYEPAEIRTALLAAVADPRSAEVLGLIFNVSDSESLAGRPSEAVLEMGRFLASQAHRYGNRVALVAAADYAYGLMRMGSSAVEREGVAAQVFRDETGAREWLLT